MIVWCFMDFEDSQTYLNLQIALQDLLENNSLLELFETEAQEEILIPISFLFNTTARNSKFIANRIYEILYGEMTTLDNLQVARENFLAAESRIRDVDVAEEAANLASANILQQAGTAILAQANQQPQLALQLLQ